MILFLLFSFTIARKNLKGFVPTCYGVNFDAGSSGTRVYVYNW